MSAGARLVELAPALALGSTVLLGLGCLLAASRVLRVRQLAAEMAVAATLLFVAAALVPIPRPIAAGVAFTPDPEGVPALSSAPPVPAPRGAARSAAVVPRAVAPAAPEAAGEAVDEAVGEEVGGDATTARSRPESWATTLAELWLTVSIGLASWLVFGWLRLVVLVRRARPAPAELVALVARLEGPRRLPPLLVSRHAIRPFCAGVWRPVIVLPAALLSTTSTCGDPRGRQIAATVVLHELAHVRRGDPWRGLLFALALPALFAHPLFWWLRRGARRAAEMVADAEAARASGGRAGYARALLDLVEHTRTVPSPLVGAVFVFRQPSELTQRIEMLLSSHDMSSRRAPTARTVCHSLGLALATAACIGVWGLAPLAAQDPSPPPANDVVPRLQDERDALRDEVAALRRELAELREVAGKIGASVPAPEPDPTSTPEGSPSAQRPGAHSDERVQAKIQEFLRRSAAALTDAETREITVAPGDSLQSLAKRWAGDASDATLARIVALNEGVDPRRLRVGQHLRVPARSQQAGQAASVDEPRTVGQARGQSVDAGAALDLMMRRIDLESDVAQARLRIESVARANDAGSVDAAAIEAARIVMRGAERKLALVVRGIELQCEALRADIDVAATRLDSARQLQERGYVGAAEVRQQEAHVLRLRSVLEILDGPAPTRR
ncbi:MAG: M56 family metallopeptidase [Planctomycetota bacterium]